VFCLFLALESSSSLSFVHLALFPSLSPCSHSFCNTYVFSLSIAQVLESN
jgi:hypothetical protein